MEIEKISKRLQEQILHAQILAYPQNDQVKSVIIILPYIKKHSQKQVPDVIQRNKIFPSDKNKKLKRTVFD